MKAWREYCRRGIHDCTPAVTLTFDDGRRRLHWCAEHAADADRYRYQADAYVGPRLPAQHQQPTQHQAYDSRRALAEVAACRVVGTGAAA